MTDATRIENGQWEQNNDDGWVHIDLPFGFSWFGTLLSAFLHRNTRICTYDVRGECGLTTSAVCEGLASTSAGSRSAPMACSPLAQTIVPTAPGRCCIAAPMHASVLGIANARTEIALLGFRRACSHTRNKWGGCLLPGNAWPVWHHPRPYLRAPNPEGARFVACYTAQLKQRTPGFVLPVLHGVVSDLCIPLVQVVVGDSPLVTAWNKLIVEWRVPTFDTGNSHMVHFQVPTHSP